MTNLKKLIDVTVSLDQAAFLSQKQRYTKNSSVCKNAVTKLRMGVACSYSSAPGLISPFAATNRGAITHRTLPQR